jgi:hypothetical protein
MAATTALLLLFVHAAALFAQASRAQSHSDVFDLRGPARRLLDAGQQAAVMQQHRHDFKQAERSLLSVANATTAQAVVHEVGQGAGQDAGLGAGQGAGQGAGVGAGQGAGLGAGQGAGQEPAQVASPALAQATAPLATHSGTARVSAAAGAPPVLLRPQQPAAVTAPVPGPVQTGPTGVIITVAPPTTAPKVSGTPTDALGAGTPVAPAASSVSRGPALKLWEQCGGQSACNGNTPCADSQWTSSSCSPGSTCIRQDEWYWQCRPSSELLHQQVAARSADGSGRWDPHQPAGQADGQSDSQQVEGPMGEKDGQHQVIAQQGSIDSTPETAAGAQTAGGGGIRCIKHHGCKPSYGVYGSSLPSDIKRSFAGLLAPAGQCQVSSGQLTATLSALHSTLISLQALISLVQDEFNHTPRSETACLHAIARQG